MARHMVSVLGGAALAATVLLAASPALASLPSPATAELSDADQLGRRLAHDLYAMIDIRALMLKQVAGSLPDQELFTIRPQWRGLMADSIVEEIEHNRPIFDEVFGQMFSSRFSAAELKVGVQLLEGPAGVDLARAARAKEAGQAAQPFSPAGQAALAAAAKTPAGIGFITKFGQIKDALHAPTIEFVARILPAVMIRFGEKAQAAEAAAGHAPAAVAD